jgi:hypothetical protein
MKKEAARLLNRKCRRIALQYAGEGVAVDELAYKIFKLVRQETRNGQMAGIRTAQEEVGDHGPQ